MSTIVTRITKGSALTYQEVDDNFSNLNTDKFEASDVGTVLQAYSANLTQFVNQFTLPTMDGNNGEALVTNGAGELAFIPVAGTGTVQSVDMSVPTGLQVFNNPITTVGTLVITYETGYSIPTNVKQTEWDSAYSATQTLGTIATQNANNVAITGGSISGITDLAVADGGTGASDASGARTNLGLGTIATQDADNVNITGGSISGTLSSANATITGGSVTGITDLAVADGGTGASTATNAKINLEVITSATGSTILASGTTAQRDGSPVGGYMRFNQDVAKAELYNGSAWTGVGGGATGGGQDEAFVENDNLITESYVIGQGAQKSGVTVDAGTNVFSLTGHGFTENQLVFFMTSGTLPAPLEQYVGYYVIASGLTADAFKLSETLGGAEINITDTGTGAYTVGKVKNAISAGKMVTADGVTVTIPTGAFYTTV